MSETQPLVSVVLPIYNAELPLLEEAVDCILHQTYENFELIIVDDENSEAAREYLSQLSRKHANINILQNEQNIGLTLSLIRGIREAKGKYIARQDVDDISKPQRLALQVERMEQESQLVLLGTWYYEERLNGKLALQTQPDHDLYLKKRLFVTNPFCHASTFFRKDAYDKVGGYDPQWETTQDLDLWLRLAGLGSIGMIEQPLVIRRSHHGSISKTKAWTQVRNSFKIRKTYLAQFDDAQSYPLMLLGTSYYALMTLLPSGVGLRVSSLVNKYTKPGGN